MLVERVCTAGAAAGSFVVVWGDDDDDGCSQRDATEAREERTQAADASVGEGLPFLGSVVLGFSSVSLDPSGISWNGNRTWGGGGSIRGATSLITFNPRIGPWRRAGVR